MKAELESKDIKPNRGVSLISETEEEKQMLVNLWNQKARPVMLLQIMGDEAQLVIAPTPEPELKE